MLVYVLGSGSSGNAFVLEAEGERLLIDAGMGPTRATERMRSLGADFITSRAPLGVFITHDHGDHSAHALPIARALRAPLFAHAHVAIDRARRRLDVRPYVPGQPMTLGPFLVETHLVPHDAPQVAFRVSAAGRSMSLATDLGHAPRALRTFLADSDVVFLESNYCRHLLETGPYPPRLKTRVAGPLGHLDNEQTADVVASLEETRAARVVLVHLSRTNNTAARALDVVASRARRLPVEALAHGEPRRFEVTGGRPRPPTQLGFSFQ